MDEKVYTPTVIADNPFPQESESTIQATQPVSSDVYSPVKVKDQSFPTKRVAVELLSTSLNTRSKKILSEFTFTQQGAIQVGKYESGVSGDIRISPAGIVARNTAGIQTVAIDGETGDAVFAGTIQAGTVIGGAVVVGDSNIVLDGEGGQIRVNDGTYDRVLLGAF